MKLAVIAGMMIATPLVASAYDVKQTTGGQDVHWADGVVTFHPAFSMTPSSVTSDQASTELATSISTWQTALADTGVMVALASDAATAAPHVNDGVNTVRFAMTAGDPDIEPGVLGLTFIAYRQSDGLAVDADVVLNAVDFTWTTGEAACVKEYDVQSAMTHELGHALGMAHSIGHPEATMYATGQACETTKRVLASDDKAGLASIYAAPKDASPGGGCASSSPTSGALFGVALALLAISRRRKAGIAIAGVLAVAPAHAAQLRRLDPTDLARDAVMVIRGHVTEVAAADDAAFETDSVVVVDACLAGACPEVATVRRRGGERDGIVVDVDAEAKAAPGDEVVMYLRQDRGGHLRVLGGVQGLWQVVRGTPGKDDVAVRDLRGESVRVADHWEAGELEIVAVAKLPRRVR